MHSSGGCAHWAWSWRCLRKLLLCIFMVGALSGLVFGRLGEADFIHIFGARFRFAYSARPLGEHAGCIFIVIAWPFGGQDQETLQISF